MTGRGFLTPLPPLSNTVPRNRPFLQRRTQAPSYVTSTTDDLADYSGSALSGAWNLEYDFEGTKVPSRMVSLLPSGKFSSPPPGSGSSIPDSAPRNTVEVLDGAWSVDPDSQEFTVAIYGVAKNVKIWFVGSIDATGSAISGAVGEGAQDPNWVGKFTLTKFMAEFDPTIVKKRKERAVTYKHDDLIGAWRIETFKYVKPRKDSKKGKKRKPNVYKGEPEVVEAKSELQTSQVFDVEFFSNSTWQSINGFGEDGRLAGKWNVFSDNIDLGTGIKGKGTRVWFEARRFSVMGGALSYGAGLTHDLLYMGSISFSLDNFALESDATLVDAADTTCAPGVGESKPMKVSLKAGGYICQGYSGEPVFLGKFNMTRLPTGLPKISFE